MKQHQERNSKTRCSNPTHLTKPPDPEKAEKEKRKKKHPKTASQREKEKKKGRMRDKKLRKPKPIQFSFSDAQASIGRKKRDLLSLEKRGGGKAMEKTNKMGKSTKNQRQSVPGFRNGRKIARKKKTPKWQPRLKGKSKQGERAGENWVPWGSVKKKKRKKKKKGIRGGREKKWNQIGKEVPTAENPRKQNNSFAGGRASDGGNRTGIAREKTWGGSRKRTPRVMGKRVARSQGETK